MAVKYNPKGYYVSLSTDTFPTNALPGDRLYRVNISTHVTVTYISYDGNSWELDSSGSSSASTDALLSELLEDSGTLVTNTDQLESLITLTNSKVDTINTNLTSIINTDGIKKITDNVNVEIVSSTPLTSATNHTFLNNATGNGTAFLVGVNKTLTIFIQSNSGTLTFYGTDYDGNATTIMGVNLSDFSTGITSSGTGKWQFDITGLYGFYINASASATVKGTAVT